MKYRFAGIQFAYLCFCGNLKGRFGQLPEGRCDRPCRVKNETQCGGEWANSVYRTGTRYFKTVKLVNPANEGTSKSGCVYGGRVIRAETISTE